MPQSTLFQVQDLHIDPRIHVFRRIFTAPGEFDELQVDAYIIRTERFLIICDTLLCPEDAAYMLHSIQPGHNGQQVLVINSHADWDHTWGNSYFVNAAQETALIIAQSLCAQRLCSPLQQTFLERYQRRFPLFKNVRLIPPAITFNSALSINAGDLTLELLSTPGHCPEQCVLWLPELQLLLAFDAVEWPFPAIENAQSVGAMLHSLERLQTLGAHTVLCSHGTTTSPAIVDQNLSYVRTIEGRWRSVLASHGAPDIEQQRPTTLIQYSYEDVVGHSLLAIDHAFYREVHEQNVRYVLQWLLL